MREIPAAAGVSESESAAAFIVSEGVGVGDSSGQGCWRQDNRGGTVACVFGGVWLVSARALTASCLQRRWRQRQRGRWRRIVYSGDGGREGVGVGNQPIFYYINCPMFGFQSLLFTV